MADAVRSVERALDILEQLSRSAQPLGPTRLAALTGMDKSTVYRILETLCRRGYAERRDGVYMLGPTLLSLASNHIGSLELLTEARPCLSALSTNLGLTTHLGVLDGADVIYIEKLDNVPTAQLYSQIGSRAPAYCSSLGKCLLSCFSGEELAAWGRGVRFRAYTRNTITSLPKLREHLRQVRRQGWAMDDGESEPDHVCIGAPIYDYRGDIIAAVSASGASALVPADYVAVVVEAVKKTARDVSRRMGYRE